MEASPYTGCMPEATTEVIPEPELGTNKAPATTHADQSIPEPSVDLDLIDLWSMDPVPTQVPTLESSFSLPVPSGYLDAGPIQRSSSADVPASLPGPISTTGYG